MFFSGYSYKTLVCCPYTPNKGGIPVKKLAIFLGVICGLAAVLVPTLILICRLIEDHASFPEE